ncbi:zinc-binding dehydrogenase [Streptomyces sp. NPDC056983]|uniref:zinc-binding dehydrogenase n=1 Tax=Streptomyces sp. NPDC056983 TaxID=3345987 RepID=UPI003635D879
MTPSHGLPKTSRTAIISKFNEPLEIVELPVPELVPGSLLVEIELSTVCGSDVHLWDGSLNATTRPIELPVVPGHEMIGRVVAFGSDEARVDSVGTGLEVGDRIVWTNAACGNCHDCVVTGQTNLCRNRHGHLSVKANKHPYIVGGWSQYAYVFPNSGRIRVPDDVKTEWASAASCALRSVITGFQRLGVIEPWQTVVIQGSGPLGLFSTAIASHSGAGRIIVVGAPESRLELARDWGATDTISVSGHPDPASRVQAVQELTDGLGAEIVIEASGARSAFGEGLEMVRRGGRFVVVGQVGPQEVTIRPSRLTAGQLTVLGSFSGETAQYWRALQFLSSTKHKFDFDRLISNRYHLDEATVAMAKMKSLEEIKPVVVPTLVGERVGNS